MGVKGLGYYVKSCGIDVVIDREFVSKLGKRTVILVDANQILFYLCESMHFVDVELAAYDKLEQRINDFINTFLSLGFSLYFYYDGNNSVGPEKADTFYKRQLQRIEGVASLQNIEGVTHYPHMYSNKPKLGNHLLRKALQEKKGHNVKIKYCKGEADPEILARSTLGDVFAILSNDNDFLLSPHCEVMPLRYLKFPTRSCISDSPMIGAKLFHADRIAEFLEIEDPNLLYIFSCLAGNDFTQPVLDDTKAIYTRLGFNNELTGSVNTLFPRIVEFINSWETSSKLMMRAMKKFPLFGNAVELTRRFYADTDALLHEMNQKDSPVQKKQKQMTIRNNIPYEFIELDQPAICDLIEHLSCAYYCLLLKQDADLESSAVITRRMVTDFGDKIVPLKTYLTQEYVNIAKKSIKTQLDRVLLLYLPVTRLKDVEQATIPAQLVSVVCQTPFPLLLKGFTVLHMTCSSHALDCHLSSRELCSFIIFCAVTELNNEIPITGISPVSESNYQFPSARTITLNSFYNETLSRVTDIVYGANTSKKDIGSPLRYSHGPLLQHIIEEMRYIHISPDLFQWKRITELSDEIIYQTKQIFSLYETPQTLLSILQRILVVLLFPFGAQPKNPIVICERERECTALTSELVEITDLQLFPPLGVEERVKQAQPTAVLNNSLRLSVAPIEKDTGLPILEFQSDIIEAIQNNRLVAIQGETGCGKSSKVPQFALEAAMSSGRKKPLIVVTQPRRFAAISLAKRVASEVGCRLGEIVGYRIGQEAIASKSTQILFVTTGWLLEKLIHDTEYFTKCTHILLDEIHERSITSDLLNLLLRQLIKTQVRATTKVVVMSATFDVKMFADYFRQALPDAGEIPKLFVGVKRYPVEIVHLDEINKHPLFQNKSAMKKITVALSFLCNGFNRQSKKPDVVNGLHKFVDVMIDVLADHHKNDEDGNAILIFLPGISEIEELEELLLKRVTQMEGEEVNNTIIETFVLHSLIEQDEQMKVFHTIPKGTTRVILATNIAESSVTLPMIRYIFDFGLTRQLEFDKHTGFTCLRTTWISQASAKQRSGRCGRLFPGVAIRLYTKNFYDNLNPYELPEMLRLSLSSTILMLKTYAENLDQNSPFHNPRECLRNALQPPENDVIDRAVLDLLDNGVLEHIEQDDDSLMDSIREQEALSQSSNGEVQFDALAVTKITHLGHFLANLPFDLRVGRLVAIGARCGRYILHTLLLAVSLTKGELFLAAYISPSKVVDSESILYSVSAQRARGRFMDPISDILATIPQYKAIVNSKNKNTTGIHVTKARKFVSAVSEIARNLESILPGHVKWLRIFRRSEKISKAELDSLLSFEKEDIDFLRLLLAVAFKKDGLVTSHYKEKPQTKKLKDFPDLDRCVILQSIPAGYRSKEGLEICIPDIVRLSEEVTTTGTSVALLFPPERKVDGLAVMPLGVRVVSTFLHKDSLLVPSSQEGASIMLQKIFVPQSVQFMYKGKKCMLNEKQSICSYVLPKHEYIGIPGTIQYFNNTARIGRITLLPCSFGIVPLIALMVHKGNPIMNGERNTIKQVRVATVTKVMDKKESQDVVSTSHVDLSYEIPKKLFNQTDFIEFQEIIDDLLMSEIGSPPSALNEKLLANLIQQVESFNEQ